MSHRNIKIAVTSIVLVGAFAGLLWSSLREGTEYYKHVDEVMTDAKAWEGKRLRRFLSGRRADDRRVGGHPQRLSHERLLDQIRAALLGQRPAAVLQAHVVLGWPRRLDHVLGLPAIDFRIDRRLREPAAPPRA